MMPLLGPMAAPAPQSLGEQGVAPGQDAGFGDLVDAMQTPEAAPDSVQATSVAPDEVEVDEALTEGDALDLVPLAEPLAVPVAVAVHTVVADLQLPQTAVRDAPEVVPAELGATGAPEVQPLATRAIEAPAPGSAASDLTAAAPDVEPRLVLRQEHWTLVAPSPVEAGTGPGKAENRNTNGSTSLPALPRNEASVPQSAAPIPASASVSAPVGDAGGKAENLTAAPVDPVASVAEPKPKEEMPTPREGARRAARLGVRIERASAEGVSPANAAARPEATGDHPAVEPTAASVDAAAGTTDRAALPREIAVAAPEGREQPTAMPAAENLGEARLEAPSDLTRPGVQEPAAPEPASAARPAPPPRSPLVQAALDRVLPLPTVAGETVVRLNPAGLGLIEVIVQESRDGALDVSLRVQNPMVLDAMRQEQAAVGQAISAAQGGAAGSLSMDLFQSGTGQRGTGGSAPSPGAAASGVEPAETAAEEPALQIVRDDRVNIVT